MITRKSLSFHENRPCVDGIVYNAPGYSAITSQWKQDVLGFNKPKSIIKQRELEQDSIRGKNTDSAFEAYFSGQDLSESQQKIIKSAKPILDSIDSIIGQEVFLAENIDYCTGIDTPIIGYADLIATFAEVPYFGLIERHSADPPLADELGKPILIDWKSKANTKFNKYYADYHFIQLSLYARMAYNMYELDIDYAAIIFVFENGAPCQGMWLKASNMRSWLDLFNDICKSYFETHKRGYAYDIKTGATIDTRSGISTNLC